MIISALGDALHYLMLPEGVVVDAEGRCGNMMLLMEDGGKMRKYDVVDGGWGER